MARRTRGREQQGRLRQHASAGSERGQGHPRTDQSCCGRAPISLDDVAPGYSTGRHVSTHKPGLLPWVQDTRLVAPHKPALPHHPALLPGVKGAGFPALVKRSGLPVENGNGKSKRRPREMAHIYPTSRNAGLRVAS